MIQKKKVVYHLFTDRFYRISEQMLTTLAFIASFIEEWGDYIADGWFYPVQRENPDYYHGGNYAGVAWKAYQGYFDKLADMILLSNPCRQKDQQIGPLTGRREAPFNGYYPIDFLAANLRLGPTEALKLLTDLFRARGKEVAIDWTHHFAQEAEFYAQQPDIFLPREEWTWFILALLNMSDPRAQRYVWQALRYWKVRGGVSGFRWDTAGHLPLSYLKELIQSDSSPAHDLWSVGEVFEGDIAALIPFLDTGMRVYDYPLHFQLLDSLAVPTGHGPLNELAAHMRRYQELGIDQSKLVRFVDNHDTSSFVWESLKRHFANFSDQEGDNPQDPFYARERFDLVMSYIYSLEGDVELLAGSEIAQAVEGMANPYKQTQMPIDFSLTGRFKPRLEALYQAVRENSALSSGDYRELWQPAWDSPAILCHARVNNEQAVVVVLNNGSLPAHVSIPTHGLLGEQLRELTNRSHEMRVEGGNLVGTIPARKLYMFTSFS